MLAGRTLGVIGVGNMGSALIRGWLNAGLVKPEEIFMADRETEKLELCTGDTECQAPPTGRWRPGPILSFWR